MIENRKTVVGRSNAEASYAPLVTLLLVVAVSSLVGCTAISPAAPMSARLELPQTWSASSQVGAADSTATAVASPTALANWWTRFNDPLLVTLIDDALSTNTSIVSAIAALAQARAIASVQEAALLPGVRSSASTQTSRIGIRDGNSSNAFKAGFDASWEPDIFGGKRAAISAAQADTQESVANLGNIQVSIAAEVALNYTQLRGLQARLVIAAANLKNQEETLQIAEWRTQAGLSTALDFEQARAAAAQTSAQIPTLQNAAAQAEHSLSVLTSRPPAALHERLSATTAQNAKALMITDELVLAFPAETLRQRPDVRAAEARVTAASQRVLQADATRYPSFQLSGSLGLSALTLGTLTHGSSVIAALLGSVSAPIFDGGAAQAQVRAQRAALEQAAAAYNATILAALKDVQDSLVALRSDRERLQNLRIAAQAAENASVLANHRYGSGLIDFQVVLDTQRTVLSTQDGVASASADINADHVRLYKALGGGWEATSLPRNSPTTSVNAPSFNVLVHE